MKVRPRSRLLLVALSLLTAATSCGTPDQAAATRAETAPTAGESRVTTTGAPADAAARETTTTNTLQTTRAIETTTTGPVPMAIEPLALSYRYPAGGEIQYSLSIEQQTSVELNEGDPEELPPDPIEVTSLLAGTLNYRTNPGLEEDTTRIRIYSDFHLVENEASMGGVAVPTSVMEGAPGFEEPIDTTVVVDRKGNLIEFYIEAIDNLLGGENFLPNNSVGIQQLNRPFGPAFPDHPVAEGDVWTERLEQKGPDGLIITHGEHRLVTVEGTVRQPLLVIESEYQTETFEWDITEMLYGMFGALVENMTGEDAPAGEAPSAEFQLVINVTPGPVTVVTRFDPQLGLVVQGDYQTAGKVTTDMTIPGATGKPLTIITTTEYEQGAFYELIETTS